MRNAILAGLISGSLAGLFYGLLGKLINTIVEVAVEGFQGLTFDWWQIVWSGTPLGLSVGLLAVMWYGGLDIVYHYTLRFVLWATGQVPWNCAGFLDYAAEHVLLRKVGGGYIFIHRLLQEYFAELEPDSKVAKSI